MISLCLVAAMPLCAPSVKIRLLFAALREIFCLSYVPAIFVRARFSSVRTLPLRMSSWLITVQQPWMRAVPDVMDSTAVYMVLVNTGSNPAELVGGSTTIADSVAPMITTKEGEGLKQVVGMQSVDSLKIPAHGTLVLEPNGNHLMVMGLKEHPKEGTQIDFTIKLEPGDHEIHLQIPVSKRPVK